MKKSISTLLVLALAVVALAACVARDGDEQTLSDADAADHVFTLRTTMLESRMVFTGVGGDIDGLANPELQVIAGNRVRIYLQNGDGMMHDLAIPDLHVQTAMTLSKDSVVEAAFTPVGAGTYPYFCTVSGHRMAGMEGVLVVTPAES